MSLLLAGAAAAIVSWAANRYALRRIGLNAIIYTAPLIEELSKTGMAFLTHTPVVAVHGVFGIMEGLYDAWDSGLRGIAAGLASVVGHVFYGYVTHLVYVKSPVFGVAVFAGYVVHMLWNISVMRFVVTKRRTHR